MILDGAALVPFYMENNMPKQNPGGEYKNMDSGELVENGDSSVYPPGKFGGDMPVKRWIIKMPATWKCSRRGDKDNICQFMDTETGCNDDCELSTAIPVVKVRAADGLEYYAAKKDKEN